MSTKRNGQGVILTITLFFAGFMLNSCLSYKDELAELNREGSEMSLEKNDIDRLPGESLSYGSGNDNTVVEGKEILKISHQTFFKTQDLLSLFEEKEQYKLGFIVPLDFVVEARGIYIPNRAERLIYNYSREGELIDALYFPKMYSPDYFTLMSDNSLVLNDFNSLKVIQFDNGMIKYAAENTDLKFSASGSNFLVRKRGGFFDKKGHFRGEYKFSAQTLLFDYALIDETSFYLAYYDAEIGKGVIRQIREGGTLYRTKQLELPLNWEEYSGMKILRATDKVCWLLLTGRIKALNHTRLVQYNLETGAYEILQLNNDYNGNVFIGEGSALWSSGALYKYNEQEQAIYSLFTGDKFIYLYKYQLVNIPG